MEGEGYPKCRFFSVKRGLWRYKKARVCVIHVRDSGNLAADLLVQGWSLHCAVGNFIGCCVANRSYRDVIGNDFAGEGMVSINGELAVLDFRNPEHSGFALVILEFDFGPDMPEFMRDIVYLSLIHI